MTTGLIEGGKLPTRHPLSLALIGLTIVSGLVDAVSYLGLGHVFTANMTGNIVIAGFAAGGAPGFSVLGSVVSLAAFLAGAVCAGRLEVAFHGRSRVPWVRTVIATELVLDAVATVIAFTAHGPAAHGATAYALTAVLALAMGLRNGTVRKLGVPDLTTTVLTLTLTGLASDSSLAGGTNPRAGRRLIAVVAMLGGATAGTLLLRHFGLGWPLLVGTLLVAVTLAGYRETPRLP